jgi:hypothetical protein
MLGPDPRESVPIRGRFSWVDGSACGPVIVPVFKTGGRQAILSPVGSTPTRFRHFSTTSDTEFAAKSINLRSPQRQTVRAGTAFCITLLHNEDVQRIQ